MVLQTYTCTSYKFLNIWHFICFANLLLVLTDTDLPLFQAEALDLNKTVLEAIVEAADDWRSDDIKGLLGCCNFKADMLDRKVSLLSGGEKVN